MRHNNIGDDMQDIITVLFRTIFFYFFVVIAYRVMGKREISQLEVIDLIVSILMAELIAISIENINDSMILAIVPIVSLVSGRPSVIIENGKIKYKELLKNRYSLDDLLLELRQKSVKTIKDIEYAILEPNGKLSIFKYNLFKKKSNYPMPLVIDTEIQYDTLKYLNRIADWLISKLHNKGILLKNVFYAYYDNNKIYIINKNV